MYNINLSNCPKHPTEKLIKLAFNAVCDICDGKKTLEPLVSTVIKPKWGYPLLHVGTPDDGVAPNFISSAFKKWWTSSHKPHRENGLPAVIQQSNGNCEYWERGLLHRLDGPAFSDCGHIFWYFQGELLFYHPHPAEKQPSHITPDGKLVW